MKATRKNLAKHWIVEKCLALMEFWDQVWYFKREWNQRVQDYSCQLSRDEFMKAWDEYLNDDSLVQIEKYTEITQWYYILNIWSETTGNDLSRSCLLYRKYTKELFERRIKRIQKYDDLFHVKIQNKFIPIPLKLLWK